MPTVGVKRDELFAAMQQTYTDDEFDKLCFEFGIELDDITSERQLLQREQGEQAQGGEDAVIYKIDVPANRYDLLCVEGLARALRIFLQKESPPTFQIKPRSGGNHKLHVKSSTQQVRPYMVSAILRNVRFTQERYDSFIDLQDKLHQNICRRRTLVSIGTHDLDTTEGPFTYSAEAPQEINFVPLGQSKEFMSKDLLDMYKTDPAYKHLKTYPDIIYDSPVYPVFKDKNDTVLSMPPIINSEHSKITLDTKNVLFDVTATDITKAKIVLNTIIAMFSEYCAEPFSVEPVDVVYEDASHGKSETTPDMSHRLVEVEVKDIFSMLFGKNQPVDLDVDRICQLCDKMQLGAEKKGDDKIVVDVPPTRSDILHPVDVMEDVGIAYGFNNIPLTIPQTMTIGQPQELNKLGDSLREEISRAGYMELLTHGLCSHDENFAFLRRQDDGKSAVVLSNPATIEFEVVRTSLMPGVLKTLQNNKSISVKEGLKLFEVSDVVLLDEDSDVGAHNDRRICASYTGHTDGFEVIHGLVDRIMQLLDIRAVVENPSEAQKAAQSYEVVPSDRETFFPGRCADIILYSRKDGKETKQTLGSFGVLHPEVLRSFELIYPTSVLEMELQPLV